MSCLRFVIEKAYFDLILILSLSLDLLTSRAFERVARSYERGARAREREARASESTGSYHTRPENQANDFEKVYSLSCGVPWVPEVFLASDTSSAVGRGNRASEVSGTQGTCGAT